MTTTEPPKFLQDKMAKQLEGKAVFGAFAIITIMILMFIGGIGTGVVVGVFLGNAQSREWNIDTRDLKEEISIINNKYEDLNKEFLAQVERENRQADKMCKNWWVMCE